MRAFVTQTYLSVDGDIENWQSWIPEHHGGVPAVRLGLHNQMGADAMLISEEAYPRFKGMWSRFDGQGGYANTINDLKKYVVSDTLEDPGWRNVEVVPRSIDRLTEIKHEPGRNVVQRGYDGLTRMLIEHGLLDELQVWLFPILHGGSQPEDLIFSPMPQTPLILRNTQVFDTGLVILQYRPSTAKYHPEDFDDRRELVNRYGRDGR